MGDATQQDVTAWLQRTRETLWRDVDDGVMLLPPGSERVLVLTGSGAVLWRMLTEPMGENELYAELARLHGTDLATVRAGTQHVLAQLHACGAVRRVGTARP